MSGKSTYYQGIYETRQWDITISSATTTIDLSQGNVQTVLLDSNTLLSFSNAEPGTYFLIIEQGNNYEITWDSNVLWEGGIPTATTKVAGKKDVVSLIYTGSNFYANMINNY